MLFFVDDEIDAVPQAQLRGCQKITD
jgi:hypothetical protein